MEQVEASSGLKRRCTPTSRRKQCGDTESLNHECVHPQNSVPGLKLVPFSRPYLPGEIVNMILSFLPGEFVHLKYEEEHLRFCNRGRVGGFLEALKSSRDQLESGSVDVDRDGRLHHYVGGLVRELETGLEDLEMEIDGKIEDLKLALKTDTIFLQGLANKIAKKLLYPPTEALWQSRQHSWVFRVKYPLMELGDIHQAFSYYCSPTRTPAPASTLRAKKRIALQQTRTIFSLLTDWRSEVDHLQILVGPWEPGRTPGELETICVSELSPTKKAEAKTGLGLAEDQKKKILSVDSWLAGLVSKHNWYQRLWLRASEGRTWLNSWEEYEPAREDKPPAWFWLGTEEGHRWLATEHGGLWLQGMLRMHNNNSVSSNLFWLKQTQQGRDWLQTASGSQWHDKHSRELFFGEEPVRTQLNAGTEIIRDDVFLMKPIRKWRFVMFKRVSD